jgi:carboxyl-terminal processing protease
MPTSKRWPLVLAAVLGVLVLFGAGFGAAAGLHVGTRAAAGSGSAGSGTAGVSYALQDTVLNHLEDSYYQSFDPAALEDDAITGMVAGLNDPYTVYLNATGYASLNGELSGKYTGIGMAEEMENGFITTTQVFKGSPAADAGIQPGDIIVWVDGVPTEGMTIDQVVAKIQGKSGTSVRLGIYRPPASYSATTTTTTTAASGEQPVSPPPTARNSADLPPGGTTHEYPLVRRAITEPQVDTKLLTANGKKVGYIKLYIFSTGSADAVRAAVKQALDTDNVAALVLDLRGNGGGLLNEGVGVASIFVPKGVIVSTRGLHSPEHSYQATGGAYPDVPLYLLVDQGTASASEIVSGALQDYNRATLIGATTFGKGLVQSIEPLPNGGAVKVTSAEYFTPSGRNINKKGITPAVIVPAGADPSVDAPLQEALKRIGSSGS